MAGRKSDFTLPTNTLDELFSSQEERDEAKLSKIRDIPLEEIDDFPDHPFQVREDEDMFQLVESIKERGVITPATVRQKEDGRYELISGHRRKRACELAGFETLRCEVVDLDRDEATILMVESNFQRSQILPSEKAHAYKMRLDAMKRQAGRPSKNNSATLLQNFGGKTTREIIAAESGESHEQVRKYIRLTNLVPELLEFVDEGRIKMRPAVELSYLNEDCQRDLVDEIDLNDCTPSHDQAIRMRKFFEEGKLTTEAISAIMSEECGDSRNQIHRYIRLTNLVPELLEFVDEGRIKMRPAVELSYLNEDCQRDLVDEIDLNDCTPSHDQAIRMRKFFEEGKLTTEAISAIMSEEKPNQREKIVLRGDRVRSLIPKNIPINQTEEYVCKALEHYNRFLRNRAERDSR